MPQKYFAPKVGRFGIMPVLAQRHAGANPLTANTTTDIYIPTPPGKFVLLGAAVVQSTLVADADGTVLAQITKRAASGDADTVLTAQVDLEAATVLERQEFSLLTTLATAANIFLTGDIVKLEVVNNSAAIDTQPVDLMIAVELGFLE